jgi:hypothetical protein
MSTMYTNVFLTLGYFGSALRARCFSVVEDIHMLLACN